MTEIIATPLSMLALAILLCLVDGPLPASGIPAHIRRRLVAEGYAETRGMAFYVTGTGRAMAWSVNQ